LTWEKGGFVVQLKDNLRYRTPSPFFNRLGRY
jgi:hypothetical protein